jgi:hypothetical protein
VPSRPHIDDPGSLGAYLFAGAFRYLLVSARFEGTRGSCDAGIVLSAISAAMTRDAFLQVDERDGELIVTSSDFRAVYFKRKGEPQLILRSRTEPADYELLAKAWKPQIRKRAS